MTFLILLVTAALGAAIGGAFMYDSGWEKGYVQGYDEGLARATAHFNHVYVGTIAASFPT